MDTILWSFPSFNGIKEGPFTEYTVCPGMWRGALNPPRFVLVLAAALTARRCCRQTREAAAPNSWEPGREWQLRLKLMTTLKLVTIIKLRSPILTTTFPGLYSHKWLMTTQLDSTDKRFLHYRKFYWTGLFSRLVISQTCSLYPHFSEISGFAQCFQVLLFLLPGPFKELRRTRPCPGKAVCMASVRSWPTF